MLSAFIASLMSAEADALCGAPYGTSSPEQVNSRNGYRHRDFDTRAGTLDGAATSGGTQKRALLSFGAHMGHS